MRDVSGTNNTAAVEVALHNGEFTPDALVEALKRRLGIGPLEVVFTAQNSLREVFTRILSAQAGNMTTPTRNVYFVLNITEREANLWKDRD
mmetsp:Transcript_11691/g.20881  ORF Transcript_11691/g.20881 Transcript_11691/m.20881 type:complete len:91 (+) Transcript_11691:58-330(+)